MNFNLISDDKNGYDFQTRFREDIHIKKNSRAYLNFAQLSKLNAINITQEQSFRVLSTDLFPKFHNDMSQNQLSQEIKVPVGTYSLKEFQKKLDEAMQQIIDENNELYYYSTDYQVSNEMQNKNLRIGYFLEDGAQSNWKTVAFVPDVANSVNFGFDPTDGLIKTSATLNPPQYDCFSVSPTHYYHHFYADNSQAINNNVIYLQSNVNLNQLTGSISFGLVSTEFKALNDTDVNKYIGGTVFNNSMLAGAGSAVYNKSIKAFISVDVVPVRSSTGVLNGQYQLRVYEARVGGTGTNTLKDMNFSTQFTDRNFFGTGNNQGYNLRTKYTDLNQPVRIAFQTYIRTDNTDFKTDQRRVYYRIFLSDNDNTFDFTQPPVFDSALKDSYFLYDFFNTFNPPVNTNQSGSMIPFKIFLSAQVQNQGWASCTYREFSKATDTATSNRSIVNSYRIELGNQLANYLVPADDDTTVAREIGPLYPNTSESYVDNETFFYSSNLSLDFLNDSYSVIIEELPLKSYKNTETQANGGYSQHILANIPCPFTTSFNNTTKDTNLISTVFTPSFQSYIEMKNQDFKTNHLRVKIMNMRTNYPAVELKQSTINFTIEETEESK